MVKTFLCRSVTCLWTAVFLCSASHAAVNVQVRCFNTSGPAPLNVHCDAFSAYCNPDDITFPGYGTCDAYVDYWWEWDWGDPSSGVWSTTGLSKNYSTGPIGAHVYEKPGTYTIKASAYDPTDGTWSSDTFQVTVSDPNSVYTARTVCVSSSGDFTGCPTGGVQVTSSSVYSVLSDTNNLGPNKRVLLRRGDTFNDSDSGWPRITLPSPTRWWKLGAFGSGPDPVINFQLDTCDGTAGPVGGRDALIRTSRATGDTGDTLDTGGVQIVGVDFNTSGSQNCAENEIRALFTANLNGDSFIVAHVDADHFRHILWSEYPFDSASHTADDQPKWLAVYESTLTDCSGGQGSNCVGWHAWGYALLGSTLGPVFYSGHVLRFAWSNLVVISNSTLTTPGANRGVLNIRGGSFDYCTLKDSEECHSDPNRCSANGWGTCNTIAGAPHHNKWPQNTVVEFSEMSIRSGDDGRGISGIGGSNSATQAAMFRNAWVFGNFVNCESGNCDGLASKGLRAALFAHNVVRNANPRSGHLNVYTDTKSRFYNNSVYADDTSNSDPSSACYSIVSPSDNTSQTSPGSTEVKHNLCWLKAAESNDPCVFGSGVGSEVSQNNFCGGGMTSAQSGWTLLNAYPYAVDPPVNKNDLTLDQNSASFSQLSDTSSCTQVRADANAARIPVDSPADGDTLAECDVGAFEYGAAAKRRHRIMSGSYIADIRRWVEGRFRR